jgi:hypothetical protein
MAGPVTGDLDFVLTFTLIGVGFVVVVVAASAALFLYWQKRSKP